ncbi:MAG: penicillin-binding protein [Actinomycetota bacterium]|nr:penicillin-binding protein [Actinomycetota bacterium]
MADRETEHRSATGLTARYRARRARKKTRLAAMSRTRRVWRRIGIVGTWLLGLIAALMVAAVVLFYTLSQVPRPETLPLPQSATITFADGSTLAKIGSVDRTIVKLSQVPKPVQWDVLAAEDRGFYGEPGVSITGTLRAALSDLTGGDTQGGSGITQQYVKNAYLSNERTLSRKLRELAIAVKLSREYSKDQILEFYLNTVYFGRGAYGIQAAADAFFGKPASKLSVEEGAVLASLLRAPSYYDPAVNPGPARARWRYVLDGMVTAGHLTQAQANAMTYPKTTKPKNTGSLGVTGPKFLIVQRVLAELQANGINENEIYARGLTIRTTIDRRAQAAAERAIKTTFSGLTKKQRTIKNALVAVDPSSGGVLAYYGGTGPGRKDYAGKIDYNDYAGVGTAAPGSSFKPYTLATALTQTLDKKSKGTPIAIDSKVDGSYCVTIEATRICNDPSDRQFSTSSVTVANAMKYSLNTTFDQMAAKVGPTDVADTAHAMGIAKDVNGKPTLVNPSGDTTFGIGIGDFAVHPVDQAVGFATLADGGNTHHPFFVQQAADAAGNVVYHHDNSGTRAIDAKVANDVTLTLEPIAQWSGVPLTNGRDSAAKTGTEGIQRGRYAGGNSDAWMVGFTPQVSAAVWAGSGDSTHPILDSSGSPEYGRDLPGKTWKLFMDSYLAGKPKLSMASKQLVFASTERSSSRPAPTTSSSSSASVRVPSSSSSAPPTTSPAPSTTSSAPSTTSSAPSTTSSSATRSTSTGASPGASAPGGLARG